MKYTFKELIDIPKLQELTDELYLAASIPSAVITTDGEVFTGSGWQRICTEFHRQHPQIKQECIKSDIKIRKRLDQGESFVIYKCPQGLVDASSPIIIEGEHLANVFAGQVFLESPDETIEQSFREKAQEFGFDETEYIKAFREIPVFTEKKFRAALSFLSKLTTMIADMTLARLHELESKEALQTSKEKFNQLFEHMSSGVVVYQPVNNCEDFMIVDFNKAAEKIEKITRKEVIGKKVTEVFPRVKNIGLLEVFKRVWQTGESIHHPAKIYKDERIFGWRENQVYKLPSGMIVAIYQDITKEKQAEEQLQESHERLFIVLNSIDATIYVADMETYEIIFMNKHMIESFGRDMTGERCWNVLRGESAPCPHCTNDQLIDDSGKPTGVVIWQDKNQINGKWHINYDRAIKWIDGRLVRLQIAMDITNYKKMETRLQQAQKMESIGTLAGGIAHDFNNILFPILGHTEMLLDDTPKDSPFRSSLDNIYSSAMRASALVKQILAFSRQESGELKLMKMQPIVKEALKLIRSTISTTIDIESNIQPDCGAIIADPTQIHQIVMNLATNAYHAMEENGGKMNIRLKSIELEESDLFNPDLEPGKYVCLSISDTGKGMDNELIQKIFNPFFTTKEIGKGTGMGLSVVHGLVKNMNGTIKVYSEPGKGTEFLIYLPLSERAKLLQTTINVKTSIQGGNEHILLVDDEKVIIEMEQKMLERLGYKVTSRSSSLEALEAFRAAPDKFDMIITDMAMPNMPGDKLSLEINRIRPDIPVLLCTGFSEVMSEEKALSLGINGFLLKPIVMKDLSHKIREVLDESK